MGLVQRQLEAYGLTTISLSNIPDLTAATGAPRIAAIERREGVNVGMPFDVNGQMSVVTATLDALVQIHTPGQVIPLPIPWIEPVPPVNMKLAQPPPIVQYILRHPWDLPRLLNRNPPE